METIFEHIIINPNSDVKYFTKEKLSKDELNSLHIPPNLKTRLRHKIVKISEKYYYIKMISSKELLNEMIGSFLAKKIDLEAVDYQIGKYEDKLYALSEIFYDEYHIYPRFSQYFQKTEENQDKLFETEGLGKLYIRQPKIATLVNDEELASKILKLTALDLKMEQTDRHSENIMLRKNLETEKLDLTPIYDFANSYSELPEYPQNCIYDNPFIIVRKNKLGLGSLSQQNPEIIESTQILIDTPIEDILFEIEKEKHIIIPDKTKVFYKEKDKTYTKTLKKLL